MKLWKLVLVTTALVLSTSVNAALIERLGGLAYYDDVADLTWLSDSNYVQVDGYGAADIYGRMTWADATTWAAGLNVSGVSGWRLPDSDTNCAAYNCTDSEMGNLFYNVLGGVASQDIATVHNANYDLFSNIIPAGYWSATNYAPINSTAWVSLFSNGAYQTFDYKSDYYYAWAVHSGDVSAVPVPQAAWLFSSGLIGLIGAARRKKI